MKDKALINSKETNIFCEDIGTKTEQIAKNIKNRIVTLLAENLESIEDMSKKTGIPESTLASYMRGVRRPGIDKLIEIVNAYDINIQWLVGLSDHKKTILSYRDGAENMNSRYNLECNCVRIESARLLFSSFHHGEKNNIFSYESFYNSCYPSLDDYLKIQYRRQKLLIEGRITIEEIISLNTLENFLCSGKLPLECQEELLRNVGKTLKQNNYDLFFIDKKLFFNFEIIDNKVVCIEQRLADEISEDKIRRNWIYIYDQSIIDNFRQERKYLRKRALKSFTNPQIIELLMEKLHEGREGLKKVFATIREKEEKILKIMEA